MTPATPAATPAPDASGAPAPALATCRVTYRMTDQMGVVYYGNYLELFEIGRTELLRGLGLTYRQMEADGFMLPVIHAAADYLAPARYDDLLQIRTRVIRLSRVRLDFSYELRREGDGALLCRGVTHHAIVGADGRPRRLSGQWQERLAVFAAPAAPPAAP